VAETREGHGWHYYRLSRNNPFRSVESNYRTIRLLTARDGFEQMSIAAMNSGPLTIREGLCDNLHWWKSAGLACPLAECLWYCLALGSFFQSSFKAVAAGSSVDISEPVDSLETESPLVLNLYQRHIRAPHPNRKFIRLRKHPRGDRERITYILRYPLSDR
jgi:hypothetical protein